MGFAKPSRPILRHHLLRAFIPNQLFRSPMELWVRDKKGEFKQERSFRGRSGIHISRTPTAVVSMDFVDDGEDAAFLHMQDTFSRRRMATFVGG